MVRVYLTEKKLESVGTDKISRVQISIADFPTHLHLLLADTRIIASGGLNAILSTPKISCVDFKIIAPVLTVNMKM